ncbi:conserved hypothetical protein [Aspergillus terreus NIH2624]|uniref:FAD/NAD(P)-binding domain-containing protein n=1 Tax=Aspergillus terreus (strain NIH 2624 / FGSC A1156) TaxID=341663 RepID=Q0CIE5_ASPTN|nr:uncharacterized protein ATEG_06539 [Aspergillus terreus NIH2624]EAU33083.1 conserved hypothetical protein [Aspergillus terreus NIH2624]
MSESWEFYGKALRAMLGLGVQRAAQQIQAAGHRWTWRNIENAKNVVIIGGSYAGIHLARRLSETLPTGYRAVLVERNSHFNHLFVFPRFGVVPGREQTAFVPYDGIPSFGPRGILRHVRGSVSSLTPTQVRLASGESIDYEYLAIATGTWQPPPSKASSTEKAEACAELRGAQKRIQHANRIAVIGGGPVGIQIATDIASYFPEKSVTLIHSRAQLLPNFSPRLHEHAYKAMQQLKINVILGERPQLDGNGGDAGPGTLSLKDGRTIQYDLVIPCTGQRPNSGLLDALVPAAVCPTTRQILVRPTLQIADPSNLNPRIFALGDVAKTNGPQMARAARAQADVVTSNILSMIHQGQASTSYAPQTYESAIKLTLGKNRWVFYGQDENGKEMSLAGSDQGENLKVQHIWEELGVKFEPNMA